MQKRRAIVTFGVGQHATLLEMSLPTIRTYADLHGYDVVLGSGDSGGRPSAWGKIPALIEALGRYDEALWLDADVVVVSPEEDLAESVLDSCIQALVVHFNQRRAYVPNTGVWLLRRGMIPYLERAWGMVDYIDHAWWENAAIIDLMGYGIRGIRTTPPRKPNELYSKTHRLPTYWNVSATDKRRLGSHARIMHAHGDLAAKERAMSSWLKSAASF